MIIDTNFMNPDISHILPLPADGFTEVQEFLPAGWSLWERASGTHRIVVARPSDPGTLPEGADGFWRQVKELLDYYKSFDVVIDTNANIKNLLPRKEGVGNIVIKELTSQTPDSVLLFYNLLSPANVEDRFARITQEGIDGFGFLQVPFETIHVLNPAGLSRDTIRNSKIQKKLADFEKTLFHIAPNYQLEHLLPLITGTIKQKWEEITNLIGNLDYKGLEILRDKPYAKPISFDEFIERMQEFKTKELADGERPFETDFRGIEDFFGGSRPINLLVITTNPQPLRGFTEHALDGFITLSDVDAVASDLFRFLHDLYSYPLSLLLPAYKQGSA